MVLPISNIAEFEPIEKMTEELADAIQICEQMKELEKQMKELSKKAAKIDKKTWEEAQAMTNEEPF